MLQTDEKPEILLVYMDCLECDRLKSWRKRQEAVAADTGLRYRAISFDMPEVRKNKLMEKAVKRGIKGFPFFTNGRKVSKNLIDFVEKPKTTKKSSPKRRKTTKKKEVTDGNKAKA